MIDLLAFLLTVTAVVLAVVALVQVTRGTFRTDRALPGLATLEVGLLTQAGIDVTAWARGHRPGEPGVHAAYLVVSVVLLPLVLTQAAGRTGRWAGVLVGVALLVTAVLTVRLQTTWRTHG